MTPRTASFHMWTGADWYQVIPGMLLKSVPAMIHANQTLRTPQPRAYQVVVRYARHSSSW